MAANRGFDAENSKSRSKLIEAAGAILIDEGSHAISARNVAARASLKPQLVHYYFRTMDDLMIAVFRESTDEYRAMHDAAVSGPFPLHALWKLGYNAPTTKIAMEFIALGTQRETIRAEMLRWGEHFRAHQTAVVTKTFKERGIDAGIYTPGGFAMMMSAATRALVMEATLGISTGHAELSAMMTRLIDLIEPMDGQDTGTADLLPRATRL